MSIPVLHADAVDVVRNGRLLLDQVSLTVEAGEHWVLLGPNGAGKSTLLSLFGAVTHPTRGSVEVLGHRLGRVDLHELRSHLGHVNPRHTPLSRKLTARDVVLTGATNTLEPVPLWSPTTEQAARADHLTGLLGLAHRHDALWTDLLQGERGRTLIARALMPDPRLLLLDEPASGLDIAGREQLIERIDLLQRDHEHLSTVLVTHHLEEIPPGTTHAMLLREGSCLSAGPITEVLTGDRISACFSHPIRLSRNSSRWTASSTPLSRM
ncbi:ABC transporter ATP-binding protein [Actinocorallia aurantiaca]|uniref:ATP-binding cassette domain-containing protein n=1 Tax=Actinocorallia aurantiaca TaxID=46204 RepID=A0ABN3UHZ8_9ACTN